jgi:hypothetical protein
LDFCVHAVSTDRAQTCLLAIATRPLASNPKRSVCDFAAPGQRGLSVLGFTLTHMTLIITMNVPNAVCMSVDYRVTSRVDNTVLDPFAIKSLIVQTSDEPGGPIALIGYAGLAQLWGKMPMGRWLRETLRGESQSLFDLMDHLLCQLNRKIAPFKQVLVINVIMISGNGDQRYFGAFSNTHDRLTALPKFQYGVTQLDTPMMFGNGSACDALLTAPYVDRARAHAANPDHSADDHMTFLAGINRDVAEADPNGQVSPYSFVTCVSSDTEWKWSCKRFSQPGEPEPPPHMPVIFCGIDLSIMTDQMFRRGFPTDGSSPPALDENDLRRNVTRRP